MDRSAIRTKAILQNIKQPFLAAPGRWPGHALSRGSLAARPSPARPASALGPSGVDRFRVASSRTFDVRIGRRLDEIQDKSALPPITAVLLQRSERRLRAINRHRGGRAVFKQQRAASAGGAADHTESALSCARGE